LSYTQFCITNNYIAHYKASRVLSLRMDERLLRALRKRAREEGRSVSGQIVFFVSERVEREESAPEAPRDQKITGWLSRRRVAATLEDFSGGRSTASKALRAGVSRKARRK
jgi:hypothetical protein